MDSNIKQKLIEQGYIPPDKSWIIRMGILDLKDERDDCIKYLRQRYDELSDDLQALYHASIQYKSGKLVDVGESATLYRFLKYMSWVLNQNKEFMIHGTLKEREICDNPDIINWSLKRLLTLDNGTSQWASASVLMGNPERLEIPPFKLKLTYEAVDHWKEKREKEECWEPRYDETILEQAVTYLDILNKRKTHFVPKQPEDYCSARAFGFITAKEGESCWPSLRGHESNRIEEMERVLNDTIDIEIKSKDHRVIQAIAMKSKVSDEKIEIRYPESVNKSWPQFWKFLNDSPNLF